MRAIEETPDITLAELREALWRERGLRSPQHAPALLRPPPDHAEKKTAHAAEQERPDVKTRRRPGSRPSPSSTRHGSSSSTRPAPHQDGSARGRAPRGQRLRVGVPHGHVWTPPPAQGESRTGAAHDRVLACVRRLDAGVSCAAGPYRSSGVRSTSLERARSATAPGFPDPASPILRHCPLTSSRRRQPRPQPLTQPWSGPDRSHPW